MPASIDTLHAEFETRFQTVEGRLRAFAFACGLTPDRADDVLQEVALVLWRRYDDYDPERPFLPWALGVAHRVIQKSHHHRRRDRRLLDPEVAKTLLPTAVAMPPEVEARVDALGRCLEKLTPRDHGVVEDRYRDGLSLEAIGRRLNRTANAVGTILHRIRQALAACIRREVQS